MADKSKWPWSIQQRPSEAEYRTWIRERFPNADPLLVIPVHGSRAGELALCGVLFVPEGSFSRKVLGCVDIYINGTLAAETREGLLPELAKFLSGCVNIVCKPNLGSSEDIMREYAFAIAESLSNILLQSLKALNSDAWNRIIQAWAERVKEAAAINAELFAAVESLIPFLSNVGRITLSELFEGKKRAYMSKEQSLLISEQVDPTREVYRDVFSAEGKVVVQAKNKADMMFFHMFAQSRNVEWKRVDHDRADLLFELLDQASATGFYGLVEKTNHSLLVRGVTIAKFRPNDVPALLMPPDLDAVLKENIATQVELGERYMHDMYPILRFARPGPKDWTLILNAENPLIHRLKELSSGSVGLKLALSELFHVAYLFATDEVDPDMKKQAWDDTTNLINKICDLEQEVDSLKQRIVQKEIQLGHLKTEHKSELDHLSDDHRKELQTLESAHEGKLQQERQRLINDHEGKLRSLEEDHVIKMAERIKYMRTLQDELNATKQKLAIKEKELERAQQELEELREQIRSDVSEAEPRQQLNFPNPVEPFAIQQ